MAKMEERVKELEKIDEEGLATLMFYIIDIGKFQDEFVKHFGLDKEKKEREKISQIKDESGSSFLYGGHSVYGTLLDNAAERYGWELGYIMWGISVVNLNLMLQDSVQSVYLTEEERKKAHLRPKGNIIRADDPKNQKLVEAFLSGS